MMIKGSLLCKAFRAKIFCPKMGRKLVVLGGFRGENFNPNNETIYVINPHRNTLSGAKAVSILFKMWSPGAGKKFYIKNK